MIEVEVTTEENREEHERLLWEFNVEQGRLDCLLYFFSRERDNLIKERDDFIKDRDNLIKERDDFIKDRDNFIKERDDFIKDRDNFIKERDKQEERIRDLGEEWLKIIHEQICELYRIYGAK